jgi:MFS family permease
LTGDMAVRTRQGRAIGLLHTAGDLGSALGPPVAYALLPSIELPGVYLLCAGLFAVGASLALRFWGQEGASTRHL